jgi:hypothetical protein
LDDEPVSVGEESRPSLTAKELSAVSSGLAGFFGQEESMLARSGGRETTVCGSANGRHLFPPKRPRARGEDKARSFRQASRMNAA